MEELRPRIRVAGILIEDDKILLIQHQKNDKKSCNSLQYMVQ